MRRLRAYEAARAKVLMAPGLPNLEAERAVCDTVSAPFNFMFGILRIGLATSRYRAAISAMIDAAKELRDEGRCGFVDTSIPAPELSAYMKS